MPNDFPDPYVPVGWDPNIGGLGLGQILGGADLTAPEADSGPEPNILNDPDVKAKLEELGKAVEVPGPKKVTPLQLGIAALGTLLGARAGIRGSAAPPMRNPLIENIERNEMDRMSAEQQSVLLTHQGKRQAAYYALQGAIAQARDISAEKRAKIRQKAETMRAAQKATADRNIESAKNVRELYEQAAEWIPPEDLQRMTPQQAKWAMGEAKRKHEIRVGELASQRRVSEKAETNPLAGTGYTNESQVSAEFDKGVDLFLHSQGVPGRVGTRIMGWTPDGKQITEDSFIADRAKATPQQIQAASEYAFSRFNKKAQAYITANRPGLRTMPQAPTLPQAGPRRTPTEEDKASYKASTAPNKADAWRRYFGTEPPPE